MSYFSKIFAFIFCVAVMPLTVGCSHSQTRPVSEDEAVRLDRTLVKDSVVYEVGAKDGAVVPDISAPRLRAIMVPEHQENGRLIEAHREWALEGDVAILGTPKPQRKSK